MNKILRKLDYADMVNNSLGSDHSIGDDVVLLDDYSLSPFYEYEFTSVGNTFILVIEGHGYLTVNGKEFEVSGPCIISYLNGQSIRTRIDSETVVQKSAVFSDSFIEDLYQDALKINDVRTLIMENPILPISNKDLVELRRYAQYMTKTCDSDSENKLALVKYLTLYLVYGPLFNIIKKRRNSETFRTPKISSDFFAILESNFRQEHHLSFYANQLNISEKYLYLTVISATGKSPGYWVDYYLISEAKKLLHNRNLSIQQVSDELNFASLSSFGKFFCRLEKMSPSAFRNKISTVE